MKILENFHVLFVGTKAEVGVAFSRWKQKNKGAEVISISTLQIRNGKKSIYNLAVVFKKRIISQDLGNLPNLVPNLKKHGLNLKKSVKVLEKEFIRQALELTGGNEVQASKILGISYRSVWSKVREYGIK